MKIPCTCKYPLNCLFFRSVFCRTGFERVIVSEQVLPDLFFSVLLLRLCSCQQLFILEMVALAFYSVLHNSISPTPCPVNLGENIGFVYVGRKWSYLMSHFSAEAVGCKIKSLSALQYFWICERSVCSWITTEILLSTPVSHTHSKAFELAHSLQEASLCV